MDMNEAYASVLEYIDSIPQEQKADEQVYQARLSVCRRCDALNDGMCSKCGCFVEARAAKKRMNCPDEKDKWENIVQKGF